MEYQTGTPFRSLNDVINSQFASANLENMLTQNL